MPFFDDSLHSRRPRRSQIGWILIVVAIVVAIVIAVMPAPYVIDQPGPAYDTLGTVTIDGETVPMIAIPDEKSYPTDGQLELLTVRQVGTPDDLPTWSEVLLGWLSASRAVLPIGEAYPEGLSSDQLAEQGRFLMEQSQQSAIAAALTELGYEVSASYSIAAVLPDSPAKGLLHKGDLLSSVNDQPITSVEFLRAQLAANGTETPVRIGISRAGEQLTVEVTPYEPEKGAVVLGIEVASDFVFPIAVQIQIQDVGGPSAGLMFSLGIIDKLTEGPMTGGEAWAGTGTITEDGTVGPIGGIRQKMFGAERAGADWFLAPAANCDEVVGNIPSGLTVFAVGTLDEALTAIDRVARGAATATLPTCEAE